MQIQERDLDFLLSAGYHSSEGVSGKKKTVPPKRPLGAAVPVLSRTVGGVGGEKAGHKKAVRRKNGARPQAAAYASCGGREESQRRAQAHGGPTIWSPETLDGLPLPHIRTTTGGFDFKTLNAVEVRHSGLNVAIPSKRRNRATRIEAFAEAKDMDSDFRQNVSLGGGIVSEQEAEEIAVQFPQWMTLRDSYVAQIKDMFVSLSKVSSLLQDDARRQHFVLLLLALRKVSTRIIGEYKHHAERAAATKSAEHKGAARTIQQYLLTMPSCLDHLNVEPFVSWIGVNPVLNPLLSTVSIAGSSAAIHGNRLAFDLEMNTEEIELTLDMGSVLWKVVSAAADKQKRRGQQDFSGGVHNKDDAGNDDDDDDGDDDQDGVDKEEAARRDSARIKSLMEGGHTGIVRAAKSRLLKVFLTGKQPLKHWWKQWRKEFNIHARIPVLKRARERTTKRKCFDFLAQNVWQCVKYRALQRRYHDRIIVITFDAWREYLKWCRRFHRVHSKSVKRVKRLYFRAMKRFADEVYDLRRFRYNNNMRYKVVCFKGLRQNVILSKFELKKRLERMSTANFVDRHTCQRCFVRWANRSRLVLKLDSLEERVESAFMKAALVRWVLLTWPVLPSQPKLTFAEKMKLRLTAAFTAAPVASPVLPPEDAIRQRNDEARRQRMRNARDYAARVAV